MNAKRIIMSLGTLVFAGALVIGGTGALFVDSETSAGNIFTAGSVNLAISSVSHDYLSDGQPENGNDPTQYTDNGMTFEFADLKPRDFGTVEFDVENTDNDAYMCARVLDEGDAENDRLDQEVDAGDNTPNIGELQNFLTFRFDGATGTLADASGQWAEVVSGVVPGNGTISQASFEYCFGDFEGASCVTDVTDTTINQAQTDSVTATVEFYAVQSRNNPGFECADLNGGGDDDVTPVDATGPFDGWNGPGSLIWQAEGRFGNGDTGSNQTWELGVGNNTQINGQFADAEYTWANGSPVPFTVSYDGNEATFTIDGASQTYTVGAVTSDADLNIVAGKVSAGSGDEVALTNLMLDGAPVNPAALVDTDNADAMYLVIDSEDLSGGFTLTGEVEFTWSSGTTEARPAFQVQVRD